MADTHTLPVMSAGARSGRATPGAELDRAVEEVAAQAGAFARLPARAKAVLLRECLARVPEVAEDWAREAAAAKGLAWGTPVGVEDWLTGPLLTMRAARLLADTLDAVAARGAPPLGRGARVRPDGRLEVDVFPTGAIDAATYFGYRGSALMREGVDEAGARAAQASFYRREAPEGSVCAVLGAGNVSSIPPTDVFTKLFGEGRVCVLKMNPVNEYVGPYLERALAPLVQNGFLRVVYGGGGEGARLIAHPAVDDVHITGSANTFDLIVWGPPGPERERRKREGDPLLRKSISSELGNVSPVVVVPARYSERELRFRARAVASATVNNASFNCNAAKMLVVARDWPQRERFHALLVEALAEVPARRAYYPGAEGRYDDLLAGRHGVELAGGPVREGALAWAFVPGLDPSDAGERLFSTEPFCGILSETALPESDPAAFLAAATAFCNDRLWGTLSAEIVAPGTPELRTPVEEAIRELRYGTVAVNVWPAISYVAMSTPWGGHPSATPADIQSGLGWVHNSYLLEGIDKAVFRAPLVPALKPVWHYDHRTVHHVVPRLMDLERKPGWGRFARVAGPAMRG
jgi:acyl-CoA reductase-like NAD-dependent aldehyde dehydrogenase